MKIKVTQGYGYIPSHAEVLLRQVGANVLKTDTDGTVVEAELSEQQLQAFQVRGGAHKVEVLNR